MEYNIEYLNTILHKMNSSHFISRDRQFENQLQESFSLSPAETPLFTKVPGGQLKVLMPPGNGVAVIPFTIRWGGQWEVSVTVTDSSGNVLGSDTWNEIHHEYNPSRFLIGVPAPFPQEGTIYIVKCQFKRANYNPNLPWEDAIVGVRGPNLTFAWWFPEWDDTPEPPSGDSRDFWNPVARIGY